MRGLIWLSMFIGATLVIGCGEAGPERISVSGEVTYNGDPIEDGEIAFFPDEGTSAPPSSAPITEGKYKLPPQWALVPGTYRVAIRSYRVSLQSKMLPGGGLDRPPTSGGIEHKEQLLPAKFNTKSTLEPLTVQSGQGAIEQNYDLKD